MTSAAPSVSVVVPCHDYARFLPACLDSVLAQTLPRDEFEVVVIDDASTDDSWDVIQRYASRGLVRAFREPRNLGYVGAYREGMALARGRALLPLDADDFVMEPAALERQLGFLDGNPSIAFVHTAFVEVDPAGLHLRVRGTGDPTGVLRAEVAFARLLLGNFVQHSGTLMRRTFYEEAGGYDASLINSIDWDLWLRLTRRHDVGYIDEPLYAYRLHGKNMHLGIARGRSWRAAFEEIFRVIDRATTGLPSRLRQDAYAEAFLLTAIAELANRRTRSGLTQLRRALAVRPGIVRRRRFGEAILRLAATAVLPRRLYEQLQSLYRAVVTR